MWALLRGVAGRAKRVEKRELELHRGVVQLAQRGLVVGHGVPLEERLEPRRERLELRARVRVDRPAGLSQLAIPRNVWLRAGDSTPGLHTPYQDPKICGNSGL